jgi:hypothetical protein
MERTNSRSKNLDYAPITEVIGHSYAPITEVIGGAHTA